jgi:aspartokinase-like uncharacterized kinase
VKPLVVKIGGSLAETGRLREVLDIVAAAKRPVVVVPGGGPFADAVRAAQRELEFDDGTAHRMALLAMHQTALVMKALEPALDLAETFAAMRRAWAERRIPVWLPLKLSQRDRRIPADWSITSDGLAARLAERLGRAPLVLVKSCRIEPGSTAPALVREGVVDPAFADIVARAGLDWRVLGPGEETELAQLLEAAPRPPRQGFDNNGLDEASTPRR